MRPLPPISQHKIYAAVQGDRAAMLEVLQQVAAVSTRQGVISGLNPGGVAAGTTSKGASASAPVPAQATGTVSVLNSNYIVELVNPGGTSPVSQLQAAEAAGTATPLAPLQPITTIFHQIRASTSAAFNVNSNTQTFGGDTGSTQTFWTLTGLGTGTWYIQFRSSFDGKNWNQWKNANGGTALNRLVNQVTTEDAGGSNWALFTLPGGLICGIGAGLVQDQGIFNLAQQVVSSRMFAICGPDGFSPQGNGIYGPSLCDVDIQTPAIPVAGVPDYPVEIRMQNAVFGGGFSPGLGAVFALAFDPNSENITFYTTGSSAWAVIRLPGGAEIAIGQGTTADGGTISVPGGITWFDSARMMSIATLTDTTQTANAIEGYHSCGITGTTMAAQIQKDDGTGIAVTANWLAIAWQQGAPVQTVAGIPWLTFSLQGGHAVAIGMGTIAAGGSVTLPTGYNAGDSLSVCTPASSVHTGHHMRGVSTCAMFGTTPGLSYTDNTNSWTGDANFAMAVWK